MSGLAQGGGEIELKIYDVQGRLIKILVSGRIEAGVRTVTWNGRDQWNRPVASGVYFCRLRAPGFSQTRKLTPLK